jgi:hypothetical protein
MVAINTFVRPAGRVAACCASLVLPIAPATAEDIESANFILRACKNVVEGRRGEPFQRGYCVGLVKGIAIAKFNAPGAACVYIEARPTHMHEDFGKLVLEALMDAWPCRR